MVGFLGHFLFYRYYFWNSVCTVNVRRIMQETVAVFCQYFFFDESVYFQVGLYEGIVMNDRRGIPFRVVILHIDAVVLLTVLVKGIVNRFLYYQWGS